MDPNTELKFTLTIAEANLVMEALSELPFKRVVMLVNKMNQQADECVAAQQSAGQDKTKPENEDERKAEA